MIWFALTIAVVALAVSLVNLSANIEIFANLKSLRKLAGISDELAPLDPRVLESVEVLSLYAAAGRPNDVEAFVFMSTKCETCNAIAYDMSSFPLDGVALFVSAANRADASEWIARYQLGSVAVPDPGGELAMRSGINVFPSVVLVENGSATAAYALPSLRQLRDILDQREPQARKETTQ